MHTYIRVHTNKHIFRWAIDIAGLKAGNRSWNGGLVGLATGVFATSCDYVASEAKKIVGNAQSSRELIITYNYSKFSGAVDFAS